MPRSITDMSFSSVDYLQVSCKLLK